MTLERLTERIQEEKDKKGKIDGRRFNSRSQTKMKWEIRNIEKSMRTTRKKKAASSVRGTYTKEELEEYRVLNEQFREGMRLKLAQKEGCSTSSSSSDSSNSSNPGHSSSGAVLK